MKIIKTLPRFRKAYAGLEQLSKREKWSRSHIDAFQMWKLNNLWLNATKFVPYYREMAKNKHLPLKFHNLDEFRCLVPVLFKKNAQSNSRALLSECAGRGEWKYTSGTTCSPTPFYSPHEYDLAMLRSRYCFYQTWDVDFLDRWVFLWGNTAAFAPGFAGLRTRLTVSIIDWLRNRIRLSPYDLRKGFLRKHLARIEKFAPVCIYSYSMAAYLLALEAEERGFQCPSLKAVILTSEPVRAKYVEAVERIFGVPAVIEYGSTEFGLLAGECRDRTLRVREDNVLLETVPRADGRFDIVVTGLLNSSYPLIRYAIGDVSTRPLTFPEKGFAILHDVAGRDYDLVATKTGGLLHGLTFELIFDMHLAIRRWQLRQGVDGAISVLIEYDGSLPRNLLPLLEAQLREVVEGYDVSVRLTNSIPAGARGKHRTIYSSIHHDVTKNMG